ncbi:MAG: type I asparaginase [Acidobacteriota bacterium]
MTTTSLTPSAASLHTPAPRPMEIGARPIGTDGRRPRVLVLYTGGTIGMRPSPRGYRPDPGFLEAQLTDLANLQAPSFPEITILSHDPLLDSADMTPIDWMRIADDLRAQHDRYDGFVVLHGTDTLAYTASALSFVFDRLAKPIVLTGSQIPIGEVRNDARDNLINSLLIASRMRPVPEVCICFGGQLLRGNRASKTSAVRLRAFHSPNHPPLGSLGVDLRLDHDRIMAPSPDPLRFLPIGRDDGDGAVHMPRVATLQLSPGLSLDVIERFLDAPLEGAVLHTYGAGNAPASARLTRVLERAVARGVVLVNCTQCEEGTVQMDRYATGRALLDAGVVSGYDMTPEAAITKLMWVLSRPIDTRQARREMQANLRGELSRPRASAPAY